MLQGLNSGRQKRILAIHDISCLGKCSITAALPILSAAGIETAVIPTAILSTHTGGFTGLTFRDLTDDIIPVIRHWERENIDFDAVYTGYLGSIRQIDIMKEIFALYKSKGAVIMVDPVMGDNGKLYQGVDPEFPDGMRELCSAADIITPNITEACLMLGIEYLETPHDKAFVEYIMHELSSICRGKIVLTGVSFCEDMLGAATLCGKNTPVEYSFGHRTRGMFHGTGDVFASAFLAGVLNGCSTKCAADIAVEFVSESIKRTLMFEKPSNYGVDFEEALPMLIKRLKII